MHARHSRRADPPCAALPALQVVMQYSGKSVHTSWKMKGDLIYFPHDGPKEIHTKLTDTESWKAWLTERVEQTRDCDFRVMLVGPEGKHDKLARWILGHSTIKSQAHRLYNHLRVRRALDVAFGNEPLPELLSFFELRPFFPDGTGNKPPNPDGTPNKPTNEFVTSARKVSSQLASEVEATRQAADDDVAALDRELGSPSAHGTGARCDSMPPLEPPCYPPL